MLILGGCAAGGAAKPEPPPLPPAAAAGVPAARGPAAVAGPRGAPATSDESEERRKPTLIVGNDMQVNLPAARPVSVSPGGAISLKFEQAPVTDVVHAVLGDLLKINYTIHQPVSGEVTLHTHAPMPRDEVLAVLESVLQANGLLLARDAEGLYHVGTPDVLKGIGSGPRKIGTLPAGQNVVIVPLQFIGAAEMAEILKPIAPPEAFVRVDTLRNLLVLAGRRNQLESWMEFVGIFDVDMLKGMSVGLFPLQHVSVKEIEAALKLVGGGGGAVSAPAPQTPRADGKAAAPEMQPISMGPLAGVVRVLPVERMNAILVVTPRAHYLEQARSWIEKLDRPREGGTEPQLYVYPVQNGTAQHLANLLNAIFGGTQQTTARPAADSGVAPGLGLGLGSSGGLGSMNQGGGFGTGSGTGSRAFGDAQRGDSQQQGNAIAQITLGPQIRVVADDFNNALLIHAPSSEYRKIESALRRLDISPTQILIEASILEVTLTDETKYGLQWFFENSLAGGRTGTALLTESSTATIGATTPGFSYSIANSVGTIRAVLNAMAQKSLLNVISSPSVMVLDNHTAAIQVGDQQPVRASTSVSDGGNRTESIQYKDTGVMLSVTPSANAGGMVSMVIKQSVTDVGPVDSATGQRSFLQRQVSSRVAVRSGETLVLGGLIRDNNSRGKQGIPILHDLPVLGNLFGTTNDNSVRTELLVMITPRVVRGDADIRELGSEMRERMQGLKIIPGWEGFDKPVPGDLVPPAAAPAQPPAG